MAPVTCFGYQRSFVLIVATLIVPMTGVAAYPQHPHRASQPASSDPAWAELQQSMQSMHETMSSLESASNDRTADSIRWHWRRYKSGPDFVRPRQPGGAAQWPVSPQNNHHV